MIYTLPHYTIEATLPSMVALFLQVIAIVPLWTRLSDWIPSSPEFLLITSGLSFVGLGSRIKAGLYLSSGIAQTFADCLLPFSRFCLLFWEWARCDPFFLGTFTQGLEHLQ